MVELNSSIEGFEAIFKEFRMVAPLITIYNRRNSHSHTCKTLHIVLSVLIIDSVPEYP